MITADADIKPMQIHVNTKKVDQDVFYHIVFQHGPKIELNSLPIPYLINERIFFLTDLAIYKLFELPSDLIKDSHGMSLSAYMFRMIEKYPAKFKSDTDMLVCKFSKQPNL